MPVTVENPVDPPRNPLLWGVDRTALGLFVLLAALVPIFFISPSIVRLDTLSREIQFFKHVAIRFLCSGIFVLAAVRLVLGGEFPWRRILLPSAFAFLVAVSISVSALASHEPAYSIKQALSSIALSLAVLLAPLFIVRREHVRLLLGAAVFAALAVACIGLLAAAGYSGHYAWMYGEDPIGIIRRGEQDIMGRVEGGLLRATMMTTLGNPEFTGGFLAVGFLLCYCWLLDGWGEPHLRSFPGWLVALVCCVLLGVAVLATQTRSALLVIAAGGLVRWLIVLPLRGWVLAAGMLAVIACGFLFGFATAGVLFVLLLLVVAGWQYRACLLLPMLKAIPLRTRVLLGLAPAGVVLLLLAGTVIDPIGLRVRQLGGRLSDAVSTEDQSIRQRLIFYMLAGEMLGSRPVLGIGPGFFPVRFHDSLANITAKDETGVMATVQEELGSWLAHETHNDYFQIAAERGLFGLGVFLGLVASLLTYLARLVRAPDEEARALAIALSVGICGYMTMMLTSFPMQEAARLATFHVLLAGGLSLAAIARGGKWD